jgi:hypothetical protein
MTEHIWGNVAKAVNRGLNKEGLEPNDALRSKAAKDILNKVGLDVMKNFPGLSIHVPSQWLATGVNQIIKVIIKARKAKRFRKSRPRTPAAKTSISSAKDTALPLVPPSSSYPSSLKNSRPAAKISDTSAPPFTHAAGLTRPSALEGKASSSHEPKEQRAQTSISDAPNAKFGTPDKMQGLGATRIERDASSTPGKIEIPSTPAGAIPSNCEVHADLKKI